MLPEGSRLLLKPLTTAKQLARRPRRSLASLTEPLSHSLRPLGTRADLLISSLPLPIGIYWLSGSQPVLSRFRQVAASGWFGMELYGTIVCWCATYLPLASCNKNLQVASSKKLKGLEKLPLSLRLISQRWDQGGLEALCRGAAGHSRTTTPGAWLSRPGVWWEEPRSHMLARRTETSPPLSTKLVIFDRVQAPSKELFF